MSQLFIESDVEASASVRYTVAPLVTPVVESVSLAKRSPEWARKRDEFVAEHSVCACCGRRTNLNVHHVKPFHLFPDLELMDENLITLCEGGPINCHYLAGHCGASWSAYSKNVHEQIRAISSLVRVLRRGAA